MSEAQTTSTASAGSGRAPEPTARRASARHRKWRRAGPRSSAARLVRGWLPCALFLAVLAHGSWGCATPTIADPRVAAQRYAKAVQDGDAAAVHAMLSERSKQRHGKRGVARMLEDAPQELRRSAKGFADPKATVTAHAELRYSSGLHARVALEDGQTYVDAAGLLPQIPRSPAEALSELRSVLASRSYRGLMRLLVSDARAEIDAQLDSLVDALEEPETLDIRVEGETAVVDAPGGHRVSLRKEDGVWHIVDFR